MSLRLPQTIQSSNMFGPTSSPLEAEIVAEKAAALGRAGKRLQVALVALSAATDPTERTASIQAAAEAAHGYLIQRELCGLYDHRAAIDDYSIPRDVLARVGATAAKATP